jgi:hypothetical protein
MESTHELLSLGQAAEPALDVEGVACGTCPLQAAIGRIAWTALRQHVLYLEGECSPRVESLRELETFSMLAKLIGAHVCVFSRDSALSEAELVRVIATLGSLDVRDALAACARSSSCPLGA